MSKGANQNDKVAVFTLDTTPTTEQWRNDFPDNDIESLGTQFKDLEYIDGDINHDGFDHEWEKTDWDRYNAEEGSGPRSVIGYVFNKNQIKVWTKEEAVAPDYFLSVVRYILFQAAKAGCFAKAQVVDITTSGISLSSPGSRLLSNVASSLEVVQQPPALPQSKNKPKPPGNKP